MLKKRVLSFLLATAMATTVLSNPVLIKAEDKVEQSVSGSVLNEGEKIYVVKKGDTLSKIAKSQLGKSSYYTKIFERNKHQLKNASSIRVGQKLIIPNLNTTSKVISTPKPTATPKIKPTVTPKIKPTETPTPKQTATPMPTVTSTPKPTTTIVVTLTPTPVIKIVEDISDIVLNKDLVITDNILNNVCPDGYITKEVIWEQTGRTIVQYFQSKSDSRDGNYIIEVDKETGIILKCENDYEIFYGKNAAFRFMLQDLSIIAKMTAIENDNSKIIELKLNENNEHVINLLIPIGNSKEWNFREYKVKETLLSEEKAKCEFYNVNNSYTTKYIRKTSMDKHIITEEMIDFYCRQEDYIGEFHRGEREIIKTDNTIKYVLTYPYSYGGLQLPHIMTIEIDSETRALLNMEYIASSHTISAVDDFMEFLIVGKYTSIDDYDKYHEGFWTDRENYVDVMQEEIIKRGLNSRAVARKQNESTGNMLSTTLYSDLFIGDSIMYEVEDFIIKESALRNAEDLNPEDVKWTYYKYELFVK